jgi:hypothetical protein
MSGNITNPSSIRQIILTGLLAGESTKDIAAKVQTAHPTSAAAAKSVKHIAWYRAWLKRNPVATTVQAD